MSSSGVKSFVVLAAVFCCTSAFAASPSITTNPATSITSSSAVLNASVNPNGEATVGWFRHSTTNPGTCDDAFGTRVPATGGTAVGSGTTATPFSVSTLGLSPGTTYYFCSIGQNASGTAFGNLLSFTTPALAPTTVTDATTSVTSNSATLNGSVNPNGAATTAWFRYATSNPGSCNNTFGTRAPATGGTPVPAGNGTVTFSEDITALLSGATYYFCAISQNSVGTTYGNVLSFTTLVAAPTVTTGSITSLGGTSAVMNGTVSPNGSATTAWFRYGTTHPGTCNDSFGTRLPTTGGSNMGSGSTPSGYAQTATGLTPGTTYYFCSIAQNSVGTSVGLVGTFTTPNVPTVTSGAVTNLAATTATLNGDAIPNGSSSTGYFRYSASNPGTCNDTFGSRMPSSGGTSLGAGSSAVPFTQNLSSLLPGTTYYYCAIASNGVGTGFGTLLTVTTPAAVPIVSTGSVSGLTGTTATLSGSANPRGDSATGYFRYSTTSPGTCNDTFGTRAPSTGGTALGSGNSSVGFTETLAGLTPGTTYYYCALASNAVGTGTGSLSSFTTPDVPVAVTGSITGLTGTSVTLLGTGDPNGATATGYFRYGTTNPGTCSDAYGTRAPASGGSSLGSGTSAVSFSQSISGLTPGTTYYFCAAATNLVGTGFGLLGTFTTPDVPAVTTSLATTVTATSATLNGAATPNGASTNGWFRYATTNPGNCNDTFGTRAPASGGYALGAGNTPATWASTVSALVPGTTYYFCAIASNTVGTSFGSVLSFTTPATAPIVSTGSPTSLTGTSVTLNASANPRGDGATGWFRLATTSPGTCNDAFGTRVPATGGTALGSGNSSVPYTEAVSALVPGTTYYYCAIAQNTVGTGYGSVLSFVTPNVPTVTTGTISGLTGTTVTLGGTANPNGGSATGYFRFDTTNPGTCTDSWGVRAPASGGSSLGSGTSTVSFSQGVTGLTPGTTYYFCAAATNLVGTGFGLVGTFTTPAAPAVTTSAATLVTATSATLNGSADPNGATTTGWFRYATTNPGTCNDTFGSRLPTSGGSGLGAGTTAVAYTQNVTTLLPGTTYYFCAIAQNTVGTSFGAVLSFTTPPTAPIVTTSGASGITSSGATLNGSANPRGDATVGWYRYSTTSPGTCNDTFGTRVPVTGGTALGSGNGGVAFTETLTGLPLATTYYFCAIAQNSVGTSFGSVQSFTTLAQPPTVTTLAATGITTSAATLNASANPNGSSTTGWFRYGTTNPGTCNDTFGIRAPSSGGTALGAGTTSSAYSVNPTTLNPGTTYYYCAIAQNGVGTSFGAVLTFTTASTPPTVTTLPATSVASTTAQFNASANPNGDATSGWFRYATVSPGTCNDTFGTRAPATGGASLGAGSSAVSFSQTATGLTPNTVYYFCAIAQNALGTTVGSVLTFTTPAAPTVTTAAASPVTSTSATLNGSADPNGSAATGWFRYSATNPTVCDDSFGTRAPSSSGSALGSGTTAVAYAQSVSGLLPGTTYYFCAIAQNPQGLGFGEVLSFTTPPTSPAVTTVAANSIGATGATLNGSATANGAATTGWFRYSSTNPGSCNDTFGTRAPSTGGTSVGSGNSATPFSQAVTGLSPATTYYYCAIAQNLVGTAYGTLQTFTTLAQPQVTTVSATSITPLGATLNGSANPRGDAATGWFRYSTTNPGTCDDAFGTRAPLTGGSSLGSGTSAVSYSQAITGLNTGTTYYYCAIAQNSVGTSFGAVLTFTTPFVPTVATNAPSALGSTTATLSGSANPNGTSATGWFRYSTVNPGTCSDAFGTRAPSTGGTALGAGSTAVAYTQAISGLVAGTTYYYCAIAQNTAGQGFGTVQSFTTLAAPQVTTVAASGLATSAATLNGTANPRGAAATGWFRYSTTNPGTCSDAFGTRAPSTGGTALGSGSAAVPYAQVVSGLLSGTTYYYCAIAQNSIGTAFGAVMSFTTQSPPSVTTSSATALTSSTATLNGSANPRGDAATGWFRYSATNPGACNDTFGLRAPAAGGTSLGAGSAAVPYSEALTGLAPQTTYYFCAIAQNALGTSFGAVLSFATPAAPTVTTLAASGVSASSATLNGTGTPNGASATGWFRFGTTNPGVCNDTFGTRAPASGGAALGGGTSAVPFSQVATGLSGSTTYYFCAIAQNAEGTSFGTLQSFTTPAAPSVTTDPATLVASTSATLNGTANPNGSSATGWFRYSATNPGTCSDSFGVRAPSTGGTSLGAGTSGIAYSRALTGLVGGTTYYYCAIASNALGTSFGAVLTFSTPAAPSVTTVAASAVSSTSATLNGSAVPNGSAATGYFRYSTVNPGSCNSTFGLRAPSSGGTSLGSGTASVPFQEAVTGLSLGATYYYCAIAQNAVGTTFGALMTFTTANVPLTTTSAATGVTSSAATLNGSANPRGDASSGWFRYSATNPGSCNDTFGTRAPLSGGTSLGSGNTAVTFSNAVSGLTSGTTYYFCALAQNSAGTAFGSLLTFTTPGAPLATTLPAANVTGSTATLSGSATAMGDATTAWFRYSTTNPSSCNDTFGTRAPSTGGTSIGAGATPVSYTQGASGLSQGTTYYYCAIAQNSVGTAYGTVQSFTTLAAPAVVTTAATSLTGTGATLNANVNPNGSASTGWFRYSSFNPGTCNDTFGTRAPATGGVSVGSGTSATPVSQAITGLVPGTTYYVCALAQNAVGTGMGAVQTFTSPAQTPAVVTTAPTGVTGTTATLTGTANPNGAATSGWFRYATTNPGACNDTFGTRAPASGGVSVGSGNTATPYQQPVMGLAPGTTYYVCAVAQNSAGTGFGSVQTFSTPGAPVVTTTAASNIAATSAMLSGTANPNRAATSGWFRYDTVNPGTCNDTFGTRTPPSGGAALGSGTTATPYEQVVTGLVPGTTYFYCAVASNVVGTGLGTVQTFTTSAKPAVTTSSASDVTRNTATLNGAATPNGALTTAWFRYDTVDPGTCSDAFGTRAPSSGGTALGAGTTQVPYTQPLFGLSPGVTYYFCAIAQNPVGLSYGEVLSFKSDAPVPVVTTLTASDVQQRTATLNATVNPNQSQTLGWFRFDTQDPGTCSDSFGTRVPAAEGIDVGAGITDTGYSVALESLKPNVTYYYCAIASNLGGAATGQVMTFTTATAPPTARTVGAAEDDKTGAVKLSGAGIPNGSAATGWFQYDTNNPVICTIAFGQRTQSVDLGNGHDEQAFSVDLTTLQPGTYYYCALVSTEAGTAYGDVMTLEVGGQKAGGCGCTESSGSATWLFGALAAALLTGRRRRPAR